MSEMLVRLLSAELDLSPIESLSAWRARFGEATAGMGEPADRALLAGFLADRVAYAFAGGYEAALAQLVRGKIDAGRAGRATSLCITEEGGGHPRAVKTTLAELRDGLLSLRGRKQWATGAPMADVLLVAASTGADEAGRNRLAVVAVDAHAPGVTLGKMPDPPFAPELPHARVELDGVVVTAADVLPGDGYEVYVKPFRTIEDTYVFLALLGHVIRAARAYGGTRELIERVAAVALAFRGIAGMDASAPGTHVALAGALDLGRGVIDAAGEVWKGAPEEVRLRWERDRALSMVAERARAERRVRAWERLGRAG